MGVPGWAEVSLNDDRRVAVRGQMACVVGAPALSTRIIQPGGDSP